MQQELEGTFLEGKFSWDGRRTNDASTLLKQFLRWVVVGVKTVFRCQNEW